MKTSLFCFCFGMACFLGATPAPTSAKATAVDVGPFNVKVETPILVNQSIQVQATVSGGTNCAALNLEYYLKNTSNDRKLLVKDQLKAYRVGNRRISRQVGSTGTSSKALWYIERLEILCVDGGLAKRHVAYP